jgi:hypothetical protein
MFSPIKLIHTWLLRERVIVDWATCIVGYVYQFSFCSVHICDVRTAYNAFGHFTACYTCSGINHSINNKTGVINRCKLRARQQTIESPQSESLIVHPWRGLRYIWSYNRPLPSRLWGSGVGERRSWTFVAAAAQPQTNLDDFYMNFKHFGGIL